jgi:replication factor A1
MATAAAAAKRKPVFVKVDQLKPVTSGHTLVAKVLSSKTVLQKARAGAGPGPVAKPTRIAECLIGDETGCVLFTARNEQGTIWPSFLSSNIYALGGVMRVP